MTSFYIPEGTRTLIQQLMDAATDQGNQLYECDKGSATYYARFLSTLKTESAYESLDLLDADDPLHGWGFYAHHRVEIRPEGLFVLITPDIEATVPQYLLRGLVQPGLVIPDSPRNVRAARSRLWPRLPDPAWAEQLRNLRLSSSPGGTIVNESGRFRTLQSSGLCPEEASPRCHTDITKEKVG